MSPSTRSSTRKDTTVAIGTPLIPGINDLPNELLLAIFNLALELDDWTTCTARDLSQVCRRWRRLAIAAPELWSTLPRINRKWTELCLERSSKAPLDIDIPEETRSWIQCMPAMRAVLPHIERARTIHLCMNILDDDPGDSDEPGDGWVAIDEVLRELRYQDAPNLESLALKFDGSPNKCHPFAPDLPDDVLSSVLKLGSLRLEHCFAPSSATRNLLSATLTHLYLRDVHAWGDVDEMIACFYAAPRLQSIHWVDRGVMAKEFDQIFFTDPSRIYSPRCVRLDDLVDLTLEGTSAQNMVIFSYLALPKTAVIVVEMTNHAQMSFQGFAFLSESQLDDLIALFSTALKDHFASAIAHGAHFDSVVIDRTGGISLEPPPAPGDLSRNRAEECHASTGLLPYDFVWETAIPDQGDLVMQFMRSFMDAWLTLSVFNQARSLRFTTTFWKQHPDTMSRFTQAREVQFHYEVDHLREFCAEVLAVRPCPLPALEQLYLLEMDFIADASSMQELIKALQAGSPIRYLTIVHCDLDEASFQTLSTVLGTDAIQWDRKEKWMGTKERARRST